MWWEFHRLMALNPDQLVDESEPIGLLEVQGPIDEVRRDKQTWRYTFPAQDFDLGRGQLFDPALKAVNPGGSPGDWVVGDLVAVDPATRTLDIKRPIDGPHPAAVVSLPWFRTPDHQARLFELGEWVADHEIDALGPHRAARDLLLGRRPRAGPTDGLPLARAGETNLHAARPIPLALD